MERKTRNKAAAGAAALVISIVGIAKATGDDAARTLRSAHELPPIGADVGGGGVSGRGIGGGGVGGGRVGGIGDDLGGSGDLVGVGDDVARGRDLSQAVQARIDGFASSSPDSRAAREVGVSVSCGALKFAVFEGRLPTTSEWVEITSDALITSGLDVPEGSPASLELELLKLETAAAASDGEEAESLAEELACEWA